jgi:hypothetical protein
MVAVGDKRPMMRRRRGSDNGVGVAFVSRPVKPRTGNENPVVRAPGEPTKTDPRRRRWLLPICAVLFALALVELVLQTGSFVLWSRQRRPVPAATGNVVLCVGDSWTQGMGSADPLTGSYPAQLHRKLHAAGLVGVSVVNGGQSGQNSRDVLERLPAQLADFRPKWLCVLVGQNDYWSRPDEFVGEPDVDHSTYRYRWRLPRLLAWAIGNLRGDGVAAPPPRDPAAWAPRAVPATPDPYANEPSDWPWSPELHEEKLAGWRAKDAARWSGCRPRGRRSAATARASRSPGRRTTLDPGAPTSATRRPFSSGFPPMRGHGACSPSRASSSATTTPRCRRSTVRSRSASIRGPGSFATRSSSSASRTSPGALRAIYDCCAIDNDSARVIGQLRAMSEDVPELPDRALAVARDLDVPFVRMSERFEQLRGATPHDALRAPDGHCNDAGYGLMTTAVAEVVGPLVGR